MASKTDFQRQDKKFSDLGIKVQGSLGDLQIIESSDSETSDDDRAIDIQRESQAIEKLPNLVPGLIKSPEVPTLSNVCVTNSENVQFGGNTYFQGPVTIKQIIKKKGIENASYTKTDHENQPSSSFPPKTNYEVTSENGFRVPPWLKVILSLTSVIIVGIICALAFIIQSQTPESSKTQSDVESDSSGKESNYTKVVGIDYGKIPLFLFTFIVLPITILLILYSLLTSQHLDGDKETRKNGVLRHHIFDYPQGDFNSSIEKAKVKADPLLIAPNHLRIVSRTDWLAQPVENELDKIRQPIPWVVITHTATEGCYNQSQCVLRVRLIQMFHIESKQWDDIGYNFLVAGDGSAYFGRGWDYIGAHTLGYNRYSVGIAFIGTFNNETPPQKQIEACQKLIKLGVQLGKIRKDYKLFAHRQLASTLSPGDKLYEIIREWPHFVKDDSNIELLTPDY